MIISHKHKYLFVETPRTGTTSIGNELIENYGGERIIGKHSTHFEFLKSASSEEMEYFKFAGIRNPLDSLVSFYYKTFNDENVRKENTENFIKKFRRQKTFSMILAVIYYKLQSDFMNEHKADFAKFFNKYYVLPYTNPIDLDLGFFDKVIRFENFQRDFSETLRIIGLKQMRPVPLSNVTKKSKKLFWDYYSPEIRPRAIRLFGPFMERFGYDFPKDWNSDLRRIDYFNYSLSRNLKRLFYKTRVHPQL